MTDDPNEFERLLEESLAKEPIRTRLQVGEKVEATVAALSRDWVILDLGGKMEGTLALEEVIDEDGQITANVGDTLTAFVVGVGEELRLSTRVRPGAGSEQLLQEAYEARIPVEGRVSGVNKGGLEVEMAGKRAFCPVSQIDVSFCEDPTVFVGERLHFRITRLEKNNIVLSRRALLEEERAVLAKERWETLSEGQVLEGTVTRLAEFGAFVDIGGIEGLVHISELSHERVASPSDLLSKGQAVTVQVVSIDREQERVGLSLRALEADPWESALERFPQGSMQSGTVTRLAAFGAFVDLGGGLEGLAHISELADRRVGHPRDVVDVGQSVEVRILEVDPERQRIGLSLREPDVLPEGGPPATGSLVQATVDRVESYGLLVRFGGHRGLIPARELPIEGTASPKLLGQRWPVGTELEAVVIEVDPETGRIRLSVKAVAEAQTREEYARYRQSNEGEGSLGTLGDLLKKKLGG